MSSNQATQDEIVSNMIGKPKSNIVSHVIPGGRNFLTKELKASEIKDILFTWLKYVNKFIEVQINFVDPLPKDVSFLSYKEFPIVNAGNDMPWNVSEGKFALANSISELLSNAKKVISIRVTKSGISYATTTSTSLKPGSDNWKPTLYFTQLPKGKWD